jgi:hypothetical protein
MMTWPGQRTMQQAATLIQWIERWG